MERRKKEITIEGAIERMASLCSRSEQCELEIIRKLIKLGLPSSQRQEVIDYLVENRYIDNARYARSFAHDKARFSYWGPYKIKAELALRRIPATMITDAIGSIEDETWETGLMKCAESKSRNLDLWGEEGQKNCRKLYAYLINHGYAGSDVSRVIKTLRKKQKNKDE